MCGARAAHTFTAADFNPVGAYVQVVFTPVCDTDGEYWVRVTNEPAGWEPEALVVWAQLVPTAVEFLDALTDRRLPVPSLATQVSD